MNVSENLHITAGIKQNKKLLVEVMNVNAREGRPA